MMNSLALFLPLLLLACSSNGLEPRPQGEVKENASGSYVIDSSSGRLREIYVGMAESDLALLGREMSRGSVDLEGDEYSVVGVEIEEGIVLDCLFDSGELHQFSTTSASVRDEAGMGVGASLSQLRKSYPSGRLLVGDEDGRFASFVNGTTVIFSLDKSKIEDLCFDEPAEQCEINEQEVRVERLVVSRHAG